MRPGYAPIVPEYAKRFFSGTVAHVDSLIGKANLPIDCVLNDSELQLFGKAAEYALAGKVSASVALARMKRTLEGNYLKSLEKKYPGRVTTKLDVKPVTDHQSTSNVIPKFLRHNPVVEFMFADGSIDTIPAMLLPTTRVTVGPFGCSQTSDFAHLEPDFTFLIEHAMIFGYIWGFFEPLHRLDRKSRVYSLDMFPPEIVLGGPAAVMGSRAINIALFTRLANTSELRALTELNARPESVTPLRLNLHEVDETHPGPAARHDSSHESTSSVIPIQARRDLLTLDDLALDMPSEFGPYRYIIRASFLDGPKFVFAGNPQDPINYYKNIFVNLIFWLSKYDDVYHTMIAATLDEIETRLEWHFPKDKADLMRAGMYAAMSAEDISF